MTEEFNLSDYIFTPKGLDEREGFHFIRDKYVKEFIKRLKDEMGNSTRGLNNKDLQIFYKSIDKLVGDKLI